MIKPLARSLKRGACESMQFTLPAWDQARFQKLAESLNAIVARVFRVSPEASARCALEIIEMLKSHPAVRLRMGIHSGPVNEVTDVNDRTNIAGARINMAML
jgi:hypothetical protein